MIKQCVLVLCVLAAFFSCSKLQKERIDSDVIVSVEEEGGNYVLNCRTERVYATSGFQLGYCEKVRNKERDIAFKNVLVPEYGLMVTLPAKCSISLGSLSKGEHRFVFELNGSKNLATLIIDDDFELIFDSSINVKGE